MTDDIERRRGAASSWRFARAASAIAILAVLAWSFGAGPFLDGIRAVDTWALLAAAGLTALSIVCSAWRWHVVAQGLRVDLPLGAAVAAYYRSVFVNLTIPGGVVGDVHRGISHGREAGDVGRGLRAVLWERVAGQVVQVVLTAVVLLAMPSPFRAVMPLIVLGLALGVLLLVVLARRVRGRGSSRWARLRVAVADDIRDGLLGGRTWLAIVLVSVVVFLCHVATFVIAARSVGATASLFTLLPLAFVILTALLLPNVGGWGPREGVAAWAFAAAGLGAERGVAAAVAYGVLTFVAGLPGALVLVAMWFRRRAPAAPRGALPGVQPDGATDA